MRFKKIKNLVEYLCLVPFVWVSRWLPLTLSLRLASLLGRLVFDLIGFRRDVAVGNIRRHLKEAYDEQTPVRVASQSYSNFAMSMAEFARLPLIDSHYIQQNICRIDGLEHLDDALRKGKGAVLVTGHFGSWEVLGCVLAKLGYPIVFLVGRQRNPYVQKLMNDLRQRSGIETVELDRVFRAVGKVRSNKFIAMLADQDAGRKGVFVEFLGEKASTPKGPARISLIAKAPLIPGFIIRHGTDKHQIVIEEPIDPGSYRGRDPVVGITQAYTSVIESYVRRFPEQWLWGHRRWKTRRDQKPISF